MECPYYTRGVEYQMQGAPGYIFIPKVVSSVETQSNLPENLESAKDGRTRGGKFSLRKCSTNKLYDKPKMVSKGMRTYMGYGTWGRGGDHQNHHLHHLYNDHRDDQAGVERLLAGWKLGLVDQLEAGLYRWSVGGRDDG